MALGRIVAAFLASPAATPHHLRAAEGEDDAEGEREDGTQPLGEPAAGFGDVVDARRVVGDRRLGEDRPDGDAHEDEDGGDLDHREPELGLTEGLDGHHVQDEHDAESDQGNRPLWDPLEHRPVVHVQGDGRDVGHDGDGPVQEEEPAGDEGSLLAQELSRVGDESSRGGAANRQLSEGSDHQECKDAAHRVGEGQGGTALREAAARPQEEAGADRAADRDHLDVSVLQRLVVPGVSRIGCGSRLGVLVGGHANSVQC